MNKGATMGQVVSPEEMLRADEMFDAALGQAPTPGELLKAAEIAEVSGGELGVVGAVASAGLSAAMPSIKKGLGGMIKGKAAKEARKNRTAAQGILINLTTTAQALLDGTDELLTLRAQGHEIDTFQLQEADIAMQQCMQAWKGAAGNYAQLVGWEPAIGQAPATEEVDRMFLAAAMRLAQWPPPARTGVERLRLRRAPVSPDYQETPLRTGAQRLRANLRMLGERVLAGGQMPPTEEVERMFLLGWDIDLGRSASQKRAARLDWLKRYQAEFMDVMRRLNDNLKNLSAATGMTRSTPDEAVAAVDDPPTRPPEVAPPPPVVVSAPPPGAPLVTPPPPAMIPAAPPSAPPGWFPPAKPAIPMWVWPVGAGVLGVIGIGVFTLLKRPA